MKKLILIIAALTLLAACSKKQDAKPSLTAQNATANDFKGDWILTVDSVSTTTNGQTVVKVNTSIDGANFNYNADGTGYLGATGTANVNFTFTVGRGTLFIHIPQTASNAGQDISFTIVTITSAKMILRAFDTDSIEDLVF